MDENCFVFWRTVPGISMVTASPYRSGDYSALIDFSGYKQERKKPRSYDSSGIALMMYIEHEILRKADRS